VARALLGSCVRSRVGGDLSEGVVVETEAYVGPQDPASHAAARIGKTRRNQSMFGPPGRAYVYRSYGVHWCLNVVIGEEGFPAAILIRGLDPLTGTERMYQRRREKTPLCAGPGRLAQALGVTGDLDGHDLRVPPLQLVRGWTVDSSDVAVSGRVGVGNAADWPLRFYLRGHPEVSRGPDLEVT
jgi:DNA-3-methyladenine glycosylase